MNICPELQKRLDSIWNILQKTLMSEGISQIDLDTKCVDFIDKHVNELEENWINNTNESPRIDKDQAHKYTKYFREAEKRDIIIDPSILLDEK